MMRRPQLSFTSELSFAPLLGFAFMLLVISVAAALVFIRAKPTTQSSRAAEIAPPAVESAASPPSTPEPSVKQTPAAVVTPTPAPMVAAAPSTPTPARPRFELTLTRVTEAAVIQSAEMSGVDEAIVHAFKQNWVLPDALDTGGKSRETRMDVKVTRDGQISEAALTQPSGHSQVDMSALRASNLVKMIAKPLPAQFSGDSYHVRLHFRAD